MIEQLSLVPIFEYLEVVQSPEMKSGIDAYREIIQRHHAATLAGDYKTQLAIRQEANDLAVALNGGTHFGMKGSDSAPACVLERETAAEREVVPMWGQMGDFEISVDGIPVRIEFGGLFGIGYPAFSAHSVDGLPAFFSETGYRHYFAHDGRTEGVTPDIFTITEIRIDLEGKKEKKKPVKKPRKVSA